MILLLIMELFTTYNSIFPYTDTTNQQLLDSPQLEEPINPYLPFSKTSQSTSVNNSAFPITFSRNPSSVTSPLVAESNSSKTISFKGKITPLVTVLDTLRNGTKNPKKHMCTRYVANALMGVSDVNKSSGIKDPSVLSSELQKSGWKDVYGASYTPQAGDIFTTWVKGSKSNSTMHSSMFDGTHWISYSKESTTVPWMWDNKGKNVQKHVYRQLKKGGKLYRYQEGGQFSIYTPVKTNYAFDYEIKPGDSLSKIANKFGTTTGMIQVTNNLKNPDSIYAGDELSIYSPYMMNYTEQFTPKLPEFGKITPYTPPESADSSKSVVGLFLDRLRLPDVENNKLSSKGGWDKKAQLWRPHPSFEKDGTYTIGYGLKINGDSAVIQKVRQKIKEKGGLTDEEAITLSQEAVPYYLKRAEQIYNSFGGDWNKLSDWMKSVLLDYSYNLGESMYEFKSFLPAVARGDIDTMIQEYHRKASKARNQAILNELLEAKKGLRRIFK